MQHGDSSLISVIGGGAIGGYVTAMAHAAGWDVSLCVRTPIERLRVVLGGKTLEVPVRIAVRPQTAPAPADWVLVTTKAQDTASVAYWLDRLVGPRTVVALLQNGIDHEQRIAPFLPVGTEVLPVLLDVIAERVSPGHVIHHQGHRLSVPATSPAAMRFTRLWSGTPVEVMREHDFTTAAWRKLFINIVANPITALLRQRLGVLHRPGMVPLAEAILREAVAVGRAEGARVGEEDVRRTIERYTAAPPDGGTSMLYDRLAERPMEHEHITGAIVRAGERHGIPTPLNTMLLTLLRAIDRERDSDLIAS
ncbi:MAG: 2-dehydropantoate 2-reductase [Actinoallomurus sp.]